MTAITNRILRTINIFALIATLTTMGMEKEQHTQKTLMDSLIPAQLFTLVGKRNNPRPQLENSTETNKVIDGILSIVENTVTYIPPQSKLLDKGKINQFPLQTQPFIRVNINTIKTPTKKLYIPAQLLWNCSTNSQKTFPWTTTENNIIYHVKCTTTGSFQNQFAEEINKFYREPAFYKCDEQTLIDSGIIIALENNSTYKHGPHGCPNEKSFIEMMIAPHIKPYNGSIHKLTATRQLGSNKSLRKLAPCTPKEIPASTPEETDALIQWLKELRPVKK